MKRLFFRYRAYVYALVATALLFVCLPLAQIITDGHEKKLIVRTVDLSPPPPPPPPEVPDEQDEMLDETVELEDVVEMVPLEVLDIELNPNVAGALAVAVKAKQFKYKMDLVADMKTFDLAELDDLPRLLNRPLYKYPPALSRRGIKKSMVEIMVIVHENGKLTIEDFMKLDYPELQSTAEKFIRQARFSAPKKDGQAVKGKFILPLELKDET
jgi:hypothetical protein